MICSKWNAAWSAETRPVLRIANQGGDCPTTEGTEIVTKPSSTAFTPVVRDNQSVYAGWLPVVCSDSGDLWLPLKTSSLTAICDAMVGGADHRRVLAAVMRRDPSLVIATLLSVLVENVHVDVVDGNRDGSNETESYSLVDLAELWSERGRSWWQRTDWLGCPPTERSRERFARFARLENYFHTLPVGRWTQNAGLWIDAAGGDAIVDRRAIDLCRIELSDVDSTVGLGGSLGQSNSHEIVARWVDCLQAKDGSSSQLADSNDRIRRDLAHTLAYGLSHEINNPLANISTRAQSLARVVEDPSQRQSLQRIVDQTARAHAMIADLMFYANPRSAHQEAFDLQECLERTLAGFADAAGRLSISIELVMEEATEPAMAIGDEEMIAEAVAVLIQNSIEAIGAEGQVQVRLSPRDTGKSGSSWSIDVCDSGPGLTREQASRAFDPYFSGREAGRGLGLGLCRAARIAELHGGTVRIEPSLAGCVATFCW